jgi:hypothetical protein
VVINMADEKDIELEIDTSAPQGDQVAVDLDDDKSPDGGVKIEDKPADTPAAEPAVEDEGIKSLREQLEAQRAARAEAERIAKEAKDEATKAKTQVGESQYQVLLSAIEATKREGDQAEADWIKAQEAGDFAAAAKAQRVMARVESRLDQLDASRHDMEQARKAPKTAEGAVREPAPQRPADPVEALAGQLSAPSAAWVRSHPDCATDPVLFQEMIAADARARRMGIPVDTPEYFGFIEQRLGFAAPAAAAVPAAEPARRSVPAAPVSRDVPGQGGSNRRVVTLTPEEQEIAQMNGMTNKEYAAQKAAYLAEKAASLN